MAVDLNMDMSDLIAALKNGGGGDSFAVYAYARNAAICLCAAGAVFGWHRFYYEPKQENIAELHEEHTLYAGKQKEMPAMKDNIARMKKHIADEKEQYLYTISRFFDDSDIDTAYEHVSSVAKATDMSVMAVRKGRDGAGKLIPEDAVTHIHAEPVPVSVKLKGSYPDYLRFREVMRAGKQLYTLTDERLNLTKDTRYFGHIEADITLTAYTLDKDAVISRLGAY